MSYGKRIARNCQNCQQCGRPFWSARLDAKFCGVNCRMQFHRILKRGDGRNWRFVSDAGRAMAMSVKNVSEIAYSHIDEILRNFGARACENAIIAAYTAIEDCMRIVDLTNER